MGTISHYDALIIGGGPAGASAAHILARDGWAVAIVEKADFPRRKVCGEFMSAASIALLRELGLASAFLAEAGPQIRQVGLYAGDTMLSAAMPIPANGPDRFGHALNRARLDTLMLAAAARAGAELWQPWTLNSITRMAGGHSAIAVSKDRLRTKTLQARIVIAAHGSWEQGLLPTQEAHFRRQDADLFAFKAHFRGSTLPAELMPLVVFPGGYGGMVHSDDGRVSISCCIRRDYLRRCRRQWPHLRAAAAVFAHLLSTCRGVERALAAATLDAPWLSAGPIRPGIRAFRDDGIFCVGNAAGEAHPIVAEGIGMAIQSSWLLCRQLRAHKGEIHTMPGIAALAAAYEADWRRNFAARIRAAALFANLALRPAGAHVAAALLQRAPALLTLGALWSGKARPPSSSA